VLTSAGGEARRDSSLKSRVMRAGGWTVAGHFFSLALRFLGSLVLTRIFAPEVFGILAVITSVQVIINLLADIGLRQALIQSPNGENPYFLHTAWTLQIIRGVVVCFMGICLAAGLHFAKDWGWLSANSAYAFPSLGNLLTVASLSAVILGFQSMKAVTASRGLDQKRLTIIELIVQGLSLLVIALIGWATGSIWSYVASGLIASTVTVLLSHCWLHGEPDKFGWDKKALTEFSHFGKWTFISSAIGAFAVNGDNLLLGGWANATMLGYYALANNLASITEGVAGRIHGTVLLPALSEIARNQPYRVSELLLRMRWVVDSVILGSAGFLLSAGPGIVQLLYDPRYASAGWMLQLLSFRLVFARYAIFQSAYLAMGLPQYITAINLIRVISIFTLVPIGFYFYGFEGAIIALSLHMLPSCVWIFYINRQLRLNNLRFEILVLCVWAIGFLIGLVSSESMSVIKSVVTSSS
jgi:O-antigen/teichoic acid export membrane protein